MEVGVWIIGICLRILNFILTPIFWLRSLQNNQKVPPLTDKFLLQSATDIVKCIKDGQITSEEVISRYISRIQEVNPYINAVVDERYRAALDDAREIDRMISEARVNGEIDKLFSEKPLLGIPFTVKESCSLAGLSNAVGCLEYAGRRATEDGEAVKLVKQAGAIPLLVSNTPELCLGWETTNLLRGTTNNPYCLTKTPGGSSGGEAALLACGASPFSVASDIAGSIRIPAAFCGVYGHKPTPGIIPIAGHIPTLADENYPRLLTVGPMARHASDLAPLLRAMAGPAAHHLRLDEPVDISQLKVFYLTEASSSPALLRVHAGVQAAVIAAAKHLERQGAELQEDKFEELEDSVEMSVSVFFSMKDIPNMLQDPANPKHERSLVVEAAKLACGGGSRSLQALGFALLARRPLCLGTAERAHYRAAAAALSTRLQAALGPRGVLLAPAHATPAHAHGAVFARASGVAYAMLYNVLGLPAAAVPAGRAGRLPLAVQVVAAPHQDRLCLAVARELETHFGGWQPV